MILQKDLKLYRFDNQKPAADCKEKYNYQLWHDNRYVMGVYSDDVFFKGKLTFTNNRFEMRLIASASELTDLEADNVFVIDVENK